MAYTSIETIALILIVVSLIKILVLLVNPKSWMNFAKSIWKNPSLTSIVALVLAAIVFYYLIQELTIIQILAVTAFVALLFAVGLAKGGNTLIQIYEKQIKKGNILKDYWLYTLIWLALIVWGLRELFM